MRYRNSLVVLIIEKKIIGMFVGIVLLRTVSAVSPLKLYQVCLITALFIQLLLAMVSWNVEFLR